MRASLAASLLLHAAVLAFAAVAPPTSRTPMSPVKVSLRGTAAPPATAVVAPAATAPAPAAPRRTMETGARRPAVSVAAPSAAPALAVAGGEATAAAMSAPAIAAAAPGEPLPEPSPVSPPRFDAAYLDNPPPAYPAAARRRGIEGMVILEVLVGADGRTKTLRVAETSGADELDQAALEAVRGWRFVPARRGAEAVDGRVRVPMRFARAAG